ncbi:unnamed protein product [Caenorhabditis bovis]|uniref:AMP-activated protein kinase glycogen-binding domain-containing protein n=1 Tax=Caenorhabditis bovis TaxID=2654633 RepID=A0A8S1F202_9PELO|nr:unnamed protein product [Caenorhabditis bovis]
MKFLAKVGNETGILHMIANGLKRFFQWILGCTYAKKNMMGEKIRHLFHFVDAPHIIIAELTENEPWYSKLGTILGIVICVTIMYYIIETVIVKIRKFVKGALSEPQSTVTTPRCLSPTKSHDQMFQEQSAISTAQKEHKALLKNLKDDSTPVAAAPIDTQKTKSRPSRDDVTVMESDRDPAGAEVEIMENYGINLQNIMGWLNNLNTDELVDESTISSILSDGEFSESTKLKLMKNIQNGTISLSDCSSENLSEMSAVTESSKDCIDWTDGYVEKLETTKTVDDQADVIIEESSLFADMDNECSGNIRLDEFDSTVLFRWTDDFVDSVESVVLTGSFFGWNMTIPMKRESTNGYRNTSFI